MGVREEFTVAVQWFGDELFALFESGMVRITIGGGPAELPPDWQARFIHTGFAPVYLLDLRHPDGRESTWFLNEKLDRIAYDNPDTIPAPFAAILRLGVARLAAALWDQLLCRPRPVLSNELAAFFALGLAARRQLARFLEADSLPMVRPFDLAGIERNLTLRLGPTLAVETERLRAILQSDWIELATSGFASGALSWPSPRDSETIAASSGIWLNDYILAYRIARAELIFYVFVSGSKSRPLAILFPNERVMFAARPVAFEELFARLFGMTSVQALFAHLFEYGRFLPEAWSSPCEGFSAVCRELFFGTQLWHDLTGLDAIVRRTPRDRLPEIIGWNVSEIFGKTEDLFPELRINRDIPNTDALIRHAYEKRRCLVGLTDDYVTSALRGRLLRVSLRDAAGLNEERETVRRSGGPLVLLGLRVENRTIVDLTAFFAAAIECLLRERGSCTVVIDGHNATADGGIHGSPMERDAPRAPIDAERDIVGDLRARFRSAPVTIIDTIGAPVSHSVFWCHHADFFITPYGTGLAKYRWICNKPGLVVAGQWTLRHQEHLHIYEARHMEAPAPLRFMPEEFVRDDPDAPVLVPYPGNPPDRWNCHVDRGGLESEIRFLLRASDVG